MRVIENTHLICVPVLLSENDGFKYASKTLRDDMAAYCFAMLEAGCIPEEKSGKGKWGRVSQRKLERYIRRTSIRSTREELINLGVIEVDGKFSYRKPSEKKSLGHRFAAAVRAGEFTTYELQSKPAIKRFERAMNTLIPGKQSEWRIRGNPCETHHTLMRLMDQLQLSEDEICRVVETMPLEKQPHNRSEGLKFARKVFWATVDDTGRFYTSLANLKKEIRWLLTIDGESLCEVDIRACQPLCLSLIVQPHVSVEEFVEFRRLAETREIYDRFNEVTGLTGDEAKVAGLAFLCGPAPSNGSMERVLNAEQTGDRTGLNPKELIYLWFRKTFPEIAAFLVTSKSSVQSSKKMNTPERRRAKKNTAAYGITSFEMQQLEASMIIEKVCKEFIAKFPDRFVGSIHDAVLCPRDLVEHVVEIMREVFLRWDIQPSFKITEGGRVMKEIYSCRRTIKSDVF